MAMFDLDKTADVIELLEQPREQRTEAWRRQFFTALPDASMQAESPQVIRGPDGFPYFALSTPEPGAEFDAFCVNHVLDACLSQGFGIVINPRKSPQPDFVFSFGSLWAYKLRGNFEPPAPPRQADGETKAQIEQEREVTIAQPSEEYLPTFARRAISRFLSEAVNVPTPSCFVVIDPAITPPQNLAFNVAPENFENQEVFQRVMRALSWFLPRDYGMVVIPGQEKHFKPLTPTT